MSATTSKPKTKSRDKAKRNVIPKLTELENQLILRMPEPYATNLREALQNGGLKDRLQVDLEDDLRHATVKFDGVVFAAKVVDLPSIVELWKTFDKKSMWKTGDLCQMIVCRDPEGPDSSTDEEDVSSYDYLKKKLHESKKYQHPHGLTPSLKNVRKRRFRKTARQKYVDAPEIEKEVKRLLRADISAVDVKFEIMNDELDKVKAEEQELYENETVASSSIPSVFDDNSNMSMFSDNDLGLADEILPDISSSDEDNDSIIVKLEETEKSVNMFGAGGSALNMFGTGGATTKSVKSLEDEFTKRLLIIKDKKLEQELRIHNASNPFLKQRFQKVLDELEKEEEEILEKRNEVTNNTCGARGYGTVVIGDTAVDTSFTVGSFLNDTSTTTTTTTTTTTGGDVVDMGVKKEEGDTWV